MVIAALALVAIGVGGTLAVEALLYDDDSFRCTQADEGIEATLDQLGSDDRDTTMEDLQRLDLLLDIRFKLCHP